MPIIRTYACPDCGHFMDVVLTSEEWNAEPPWCPKCLERSRMAQEFKPPAIGGSHASRAGELALKIAEEDYGVSNITSDHRPGGKPKVTYKDDSGSRMPAQWQTGGNEWLAGQVAAGKAQRLANGGTTGLDVLQEGLKSGAIPDLIEASKRRSAKVW